METVLTVFGIIFLAILVLLVLGVFAIIVYAFNVGIKAFKKSQAEEARLREEFKRVP